MDAAIAHEVSQIVFTSVNRREPACCFRRHVTRPYLTTLRLMYADGDVPTAVPHFKSKHNIEEHLIRHAGDKVKWT